MLVWKCVHQRRYSGKNPIVEPDFQLFWSNLIPKPISSKKNQTDPATFSVHLIVKSLNLTSFSIAYDSSPLDAATRHTVNELRKVENKRVGYSEKMEKETTTENRQPPYIYATVKWKKYNPQAQQQKINKTSPLDRCMQKSTLFKRLKHLLRRDITKHKLI